MKTYLEKKYTKERHNWLLAHLGAKHDLSRNQWYVPDGVDLGLFRQFLPPELRKWFGGFARRAR